MVRAALSILALFLYSPGAAGEPVDPPAVLTLLRCLSADDFDEREKADQKLRRFDPLVARSILEPSIPFACDAETRLRLTKIVAELKSRTKADWTPVGMMWSVALRAAAEGRRAAASRAVGILRLACNEAPLAGETSTSTEVREFMKLVGASRASDETVASALERFERSETDAKRASTLSLSDFSKSERNRLHSLLYALGNLHPDCARMSEFGRVASGDLAVTGSSTLVQSMEALLAGFHREKVWKGDE